MKRIVLVLVLCIISGFVFSQKAVKLAHVDVQAIFGEMPEKAAATKEVEDYAKTLEESKMKEYSENKDTWSALIRQDKEEAIMSLQTRIQNFQQQAETDLQNREAALLEPITNKIKDAINAVASEQGFTYVYDKTTLLYTSPDATDITNDVKAKLGIKK